MDVFLDELMVVLDIEIQSIYYRFSAILPQA
jgi:hypothetical protein